VRRGVLGHERLDRRHAHHRRVADDIVHLLALDRPLRERQADGGLRRRRKFVEQPQIRAVFRDTLHTRAKLTSDAVEHRHLVAGREPQHLRQMTRLVAGQPRRLRARVDRFGKKPRQHAVIIECEHVGSTNPHR
jgi:hypothetical protein